MDIMACVFKCLSCKRRGLKKKAHKGETRIFKYFIDALLVMQETLSLDGLLDRLIGQKFKIDTIKTIVNNCFTRNIGISKDEVDARKRKITGYQNQLQKLLKHPRIEQRTEEWYAMRKTLITASEFAQALGKAKFGTQKQFFQKKCGYEEEKAFNSSAPPLKWGTMFEPVACEIYALRTKQRVHEFGLLRHPTINYFGASPDGITNNGIMLEIKCPWQRKITGEVPLQYYYQIQGQLSVCDLEECDYEECSFHEYEAWDSWCASIENGQEAGFIVEDLVNNKYSYSQVYYNDTAPSEETCDELIKHMVASEGMTSYKVRFWVLSVFNVVRVYRDDAFLRNEFLALDHIWNRICEYKNNYALYKAEVMGGGGASGSSKRAHSMTVALESAAASASDETPRYMFHDD